MFQKLFLFLFLLFSFSACSDNKKKENEYIKFTGYSRNFIRKRFV